MLFNTTISDNKCQGLYFQIILITLKIRTDENKLQVPQMGINIFLINYLSLSPLHSLTAHRMQKVIISPVNYRNYEGVLLGEKKHRIQNQTNCGELEHYLRSIGIRGHLLKWYSLILGEPSWVLWLLRTLRKGKSKSNLCFLLLDWW